MNVAHWERVQALFLKASELSAEARGSFLDAQCAGQNETRAMVEALLASDEASEERLWGIVESAAVDVQAAEAAQATGQRIGPYVIEREIGHGGMGTVYLALRADEQFQQRVAIKVINRGMRSDFTLASFRRERQVLANLQHPHIARLLDGGSTTDGLPYFAMEYLEGASLAEYCAKLPVRARLELFLQVCSAVQYAHRHLVVHGDLKPGNVLVADGIPKLLDFGIATLADAHDAGGPAVSPMTARYASPEQVRRMPLTPAADIYSLGAILTELVPAGQAELQEIAAMAMREDPEGRYASVDDLAADIRRHQQCRPLAAHPRSPWYRTDKFVRRRWLPLLTAAAVFFSLVGGITAARIQAREARFARKRAEDRLTQMVSLSNRSLTDVSTLMEHLPGALPARRVLIGTTLNLLQDLARDANSNVSLRYALAKAYEELADLQGGPDEGNFGETAGAIQNFRTAANLLEAIPMNQRPATEHLLMWLEVRRKLATLLDVQNASQDVASLLTETIAAIDHSPAAQRDDKRVAQGKASLYVILSRSEARVNPARAREYAELSVAALAPLVEAYPADDDLRYDLSRAHVQIGFVQMNLGEPEATAGHYRTAMLLREQLVREHPSDAVYRRSLILIYQHFGSVEGGALVANLGKPDTARFYYKKAIALADASPADPENSLAPADYAELLLRLAALDVPREELAGSLAMLRRAAGILGSPEPSNTTLPARLKLATVRAYMGRRLVQLGDYEQAVKEYEQSMTIVNGILATRPADLDAAKTGFETECDMTRALALAGRRAPALELARKLIGKAQGDATKSARAYLALASVHRALQESGHAREAAQQALRLATPRLTGRSWDPNAATIREARQMLASSGSALR